MDVGFGKWSRSILRRVMTIQAQRIDRIKAQVLTMRCMARRTFNSFLICAEVMCAVPPLIKRRDMAISADSGAAVNLYRLRRMICRIQPVAGFALDVLGHEGLGRGVIIGCVTR